MSPAFTPSKHPSLIPGLLFPLNDLWMSSTNNDKYFLPRIICLTCFKSFTSYQNQWGPYCYYFRWEVRKLPRGNFSQSWQRLGLQRNAQVTAKPSCFQTFRHHHNSLCPRFVGAIECREEFDSKTGKEQDQLLNFTGSSAKWKDGTFCSKIKNI